MTPSPRRLATLLSPVFLTAALAGCGGGGDPIAEAINGQTVTVELPPPAPAATPGEPAPAEPATPAESADGGAEAPAGEGPAAPPAGSRAPRPAPPAPQLTVHLRAPTALRDRPGGRVLARLEPRTEFDSPTVLAVVRQRPGWLGVISTQLENGRIGWISAEAPLESHRSRYRVDASLRRREVVVRRDGRVVQRFPVAIGSPGTPTPTGRFAVTDKLLTNSTSSPYGCCILALSGHQTATPQGWGGGDRLAIHATNLPETIGTRASLGCLRAPTDAIRRAVGTVPLGTVVTISA